MRWLEELMQGRPRARVWLHVETGGTEGARIGEVAGFRGFELPVVPLIGVRRGGGFALSRPSWRGCKGEPGRLKASGRRPLEWR